MKLICLAACMAMLSIVASRSDLNRDLATVQESSSGRKDGRSRVIRDLTDDDSGESVDGDSKESKTTLTGHLTSQNNDVTHTFGPAADDINTTGVIALKPTVFGGENKNGPSSAKPSMQLIGIVVGIVLASVLITGFIRWRVKKHLEAKRKRKLAEADRPSFSKKIMPTQHMDTIYECEETTEATPCHVTTARGRQVCSPKRDKRKHKNKNLKKRKKLDGVDRLLCSGSSRVGSDGSRLSSQYDAVWDKRIYNAPTGQPALRRSSLPEEVPLTGGTTRLDTPPVASPSRSPSSARSMMNSIMNTWSSLTFNRDWVGRRWLERHNMQIHDVLRQGGAGQTRRQTTAAPSDVTEDEEMSISSDTISVKSDGSTSDVTGPMSSQPQEAITHDWSQPYVMDENANMTSPPVVDETTAPGDSGADTRVESPLLNRNYGGGACGAPLSRSLEMVAPSARLLSPTPHFNQNIHRQLLFAGHQRLFARSDANLGRHGSQSERITGRHQRSSQAPRSPRCARGEQHGSDSSTSYPGQDNNFCTDTFSKDFPRHDGVVLHQLSDGSKIIILPPPYHNDSPPPYHK